MLINLPAGRDVHRVEEVQGEQYELRGREVGEIVGHINTGMNQYLTVQVKGSENLKYVMEYLDLYGRWPR